MLLGDALELRHGRIRHALGAAEPVLRELGEALGSDGEIVIVPGNHDHRLLRGWLERRAADPATPSLGLESVVQWSAGEPLAVLAAAAAPASMRAYYPGLWLHDGVYATHGHYLDRHITVPILERLGAGVMARITGESESGPTRAEGYEAVLAPLYAWIDGIAEAGGARGDSSQPSIQVRAWRALTPAGRSQVLRRALVSAGFGGLVAGLNRAGLGPLRPGLGGAELRKAGLRAFSDVLDRLGVRCSHAIFGHTHRAGPLAGDEPGEWTTPSATELLNTGSWLHEPGLLGGDPARSPYRPGFCALVTDVEVPRLLNLLEGRGPG